MRLTTKGRFAVTAMIDLAIRQHDGPVTLAGISERQRISLSYLEQLFGKLRRSQLVSSVRGPGGGYRLTKALGDISVAEIIHAVDESLDATQCGGKRDCSEDRRVCMTHDLWTNLNKKMFDYLDSVNLAELVAQQHAALDVLHDERVVQLKAPQSIKKEPTQGAVASV
ncbi:MAG: Fe-S cluster assembly transcriptional regulator IscR [Rugosibacter sp.]|jgi:Rrf2 family iron-sulfur cluster assembly transcriptional regulator|nr:Fe-S cluster assembly transcriptional regulator IscR [Rugosibacter sp.]MDO9272826.1 Fe-S cluster assembly transcriptional regulator IscR [Rugosibacter sp.]